MNTDRFRNVYSINRTGPIRWVYASFLFILCTLFILSAGSGPVYAAPSVSLRSSPPASVRVYEKYEAKFNITSQAVYPMFEYAATSAIPGVTPLTQKGITVTAEITKPGGAVVTHPAFYMTETTRSGTSPNVVFTETNQKYWTLRFSPQDQGTHTVVLKVTDATGTTSFPVGSFTATAPVRPGFVKVSQSDPRYFEYSNGQIYWPTGPVYWDENFANFKNTGVNWTRPWMGGQGMYSANWARWKSSAENHGNEGISTRLSFINDANQKFPGSDGLAYDLEHPGARHYWLTGWGDDRNFTPIRPNTTYQIKLIAKVTGVSGPRLSGNPYGLAVKFYDPIWNDPTDDQVETTIRNAPRPFNHITSTTGTNGWQTFETTFTTPSGTGSDIWVILDNVTAGKALIYELSIKLNGVEIVRNPVADMHTYVEQRPAAFYDWMVNEAEANDIHIQFNVHDKNDPVFRTLNENGTWATWLNGTGYNQDYNSKSSWLKRQWYRYLIARYSYSTSVMTLEAVNEENPNDPSHRETVYESLLTYGRSINAHPTLYNTSFWCCSLRDGFTFYANPTQYPLIPFIDLHEYSGYPNTVSYNTGGQDVAKWVNDVGEFSFSKNPGKPLIWAEIGIDDSGVNSNTSGIWYHNLLWTQLVRGAPFAAGYWHAAHIHNISGGRAKFTQPFAAFINGIDLHRGGYGAIAATSSNAKIRVYGQKKSDGTRAYAWVQNSDSEWNKTPTSQSASVTITLKPGTTFTVERWDTFTGTVSQTSTVSSNSSGALSLNISGLTTDTAYKIYTGSATPPSPTPTSGQTQPTATPASTSTPAPSATPTLPPPYPIPGDANNDTKVDGVDYTAWLLNYNPDGPVYGGAALGDYSRDYKVDGVDYTIWLLNYNPDGASASPTPTTGSQPTPTRTPTPVPPTPTRTPTPVPPSPTPSGPTPTPMPLGPSEWTQHAHDAQRTNFQPNAVPAPWRWKWAWNGPTSSGGLTKVTNPGSPTRTGSLPRNVQPVTGDNRVYISAGNDGVYALSQTNGAKIWQVNPGGQINSTVAYDADTGSVFAVSANGYLYKMSASQGSTIGSFNGSDGGTSNLPLPPLVLGDRVIFSMGNSVYAVNKSTMTQIWRYNAGSPVHTPPSYSQNQNRNLVVVVTENLRVHGISNANGTSAWVSTVISSLYTGGDPAKDNCGAAEVKYGWPVVADSTGYVFIKLRLCWNQALWNSSINALYGLSLDNGNRVLSNLVIGAGGYGDGDYLPIGPQPVIRRHDNGAEVMYTFFRGRAVGDPRWDSHFGQVAIANNTVSGLSAGQIREIPYDYPPGSPLSSQYILSDEQPYISMAGDYIFGGHWMAGLSLKITNPLTSLTSANTDTFLSSTADCTNSSTHYCNSTMSQVGDSRNYTKGFYLYYNRSGVYDLYWSEYTDTVVSNNLILHRSNDGAIIALENGNPTAELLPVEPQVAGLTTGEFDETDNGLLLTGKSWKLGGTVEYVMNNGKHLIIAFSDTHQGHPKLMIAKNDWVAFSQPDIPIGRNTATFIREGDSVMGYGTITYYQGDPVIYISDPSQFIKSP